MSEKLRIVKMERRTEFGCEVFSVYFNTNQSVTITIPWYEAILRDDKDYQPLVM